MDARGCASRRVVPTPGPGRGRVSAGHRTAAGAAWPDLLRALRFRAPPDVTRRLTALFLSLTLFAVASPAAAGTLVHTLEIKPLIELVPGPQFVLELPSLLDTEGVLPTDPPSRIRRPNLERLVINPVAFLLIPLFNFSVTEIPDQIVAATDPGRVVADPVQVISVLASGAPGALSGFDPAIVMLEEALLFGISGTAYPGALSAVPAADIASALPAGSELDRFATPDASTFWVSRFTLPARELIALAPEPGTAWLSAFALLAAIGWRRLRRAARRAALCALALAALLAGVAVQRVAAAPVRLAETAADVKVVVKLHPGGPFSVAGVGITNGINLLDTLDNFYVLAVSSAVAENAVDRDVDVARGPDFAADRTKRQKQKDAALELEEIKHGLLIDSSFDGEKPPPVIGRQDGVIVNLRAVSATAAPHQAKVPRNRIHGERKSWVREPSRAPRDAAEFELATFDAQQSTSALATANGTHHALAEAGSVGRLGPIRIENTFNETSGVPAGFMPTVVLDWTVSKLAVKTENAHTIAFASHQVQMFDPFPDVPGEPGAVGDPVILKEFGFTIMSEDGAITRKEGSSKTVDDWLAANTEVNGGELKLKDGAATTFSVSGELDPKLRSAPGAEISLYLNMVNYEFSYETPPIGNFQQGEKAGSEEEKGAGEPAPNVHWNPATQMLRFDEIPIGTLSREAGGGIDPRYADDPLLGAVLHIDPLVFAMNPDGRDFFAGTELRITDGVTDFLTARLPSLFVDESLYALQGINLFGFLEDVELDLEAGSRWVNDYHRRLATDRSLIPELFVGLDGLLPDLLGAGSFADAGSADLYAGVWVSFSTGRLVYEPGSAALVCAGLVLLIFAARRRVSGHGAG